MDMPLDGLIDRASGHLHRAIRYGETIQFEEMLATDVLTGRLPAEEPARAAMLDTLMAELVHAKFDRLVTADRVLSPDDASSFITTSTLADTLIDAIRAQGVDFAKVRELIADAIRQQAHDREWARRP